MSIKEKEKTWIDSSGTCRYGFNGKEKDQDGEWGATNYDYGFRIYNPDGREESLVWMSKYISGFGKRLKYNANGVGQQIKFARVILGAALGFVPPEIAI